MEFGGRLRGWGRGVDVRIGQVGILKSAAVRKFMNVLKINLVKLMYR
jgi:hypothetical protein